MDVSQITDYLYIGTRRSAFDAEAVRRLDVHLIIDMVAFRRPPGQLQAQPAPVLWLPTVDFVLIPIPLKKLARGVRAALPVIGDGHSILVYCEAGRHRSVAMASAILIAMGHTPEQAMALIVDKRPVADPYAWHIQRQIRRFPAYWQKHRQEEP